MSQELGADRDQIANQVNRLRELAEKITYARTELNGADAQIAAAVWADDPHSELFRSNFARNMSAGVQILDNARGEALYIAEQLRAALEDVEETDAAMAHEFLTAVNATIETLEA
jgi:multidrug resistance efflux pump